MSRNVRGVLCAMIGLAGAMAVSPGPVLAEGWPMFGHDRCRSGISHEQLKPPLVRVWTFKAPHPPNPAWPPPARQDYWHRLHDLRATETYDRAFGVIGAGGLVYLGSSADGRVYALDAHTGRIRWTFFTEGPVRFAPVLSGNRLYVGSDDGCVYCLSTADGSLLWKFDASESARWIPGNGTMISARPVRCGLVVDGGALYVTAGLFPVYGTYLFALNAGDGSVRWRRKLGVSPQGYLLASDDRLYVPTGRTDPAVFRRSDGEPLGKLPSAGGAYAVLSSGDDILVTGPGRGAKQISADDTKTKDTIATFDGLRMLLDGSIAYMQSETRLSAFDRTRYLKLSREKNAGLSRRKELSAQLKKLSPKSPEANRLRQNLQELDTQLDTLGRRMRDCYLWTVSCRHPYSMIMAGDLLFLGGEGEIAAVDSTDGRTVWTAPVNGRAFCLSVADGALYVSTDAGYLHCFRDGTAAAATAGAAPVMVEHRADPYPRDRLTPLYAQAAQYIAQRCPVKKGYCLVLDCEYGRLAYELARWTELQIIGVERDAAKVAAARRALAAAGLYGRVVVHHRPEGMLPYTHYFANLIVSDGALATGRMPRSQQLFNLLRPCGGLLLLGVPARENEAKQALWNWGNSTAPGWQVRQAAGLLWGSTTRGSLPGTGQWTHWLAEPGNSACSGDELVRGPMTLQWFGQPGPERMIDRHHRNVPPLYKNGRLFVPGDDIVFAVDAYNGTIQWQVEIPNSRRLGVFLDSGSMVIDEDLLYVVVEDQCHAFDVRSGEHRRQFTMPQLIEGRSNHWGYVALAGDALIGSGRRQGASYTMTSRDADNALWHRNMKVVTSEYLFALDKTTGRRLWDYRKGLILNPTIAVGEGRVYFVETTSPAALEDELGRMPVKTLFNGGRQFLTAVDIETGRPAFRRRIETGKFTEPVYLSHAMGVVLLSGSSLVEKSVRYFYDAFDGLSGDLLWSAEHDTGLATDGGHGEYNRHPTILGETVYAWPYAYHIRTGKKIHGWKMDRRGHGCGGISASAHCLFWRGGNPWMYDTGPGGGPARLTSTTRPGCWINMIPAGGLVLIPEASSGCTCGYSIQTSLALIPAQTLK